MAHAALSALFEIGCVVLAELGQQLIVILKQVGTGLREETDHRVFGNGDALGQQRGRSRGLMSSKRNHRAGERTRIEADLAQRCQ